MSKESSKSDKDEKKRSRSRSSSSSRRRSRSADPKYRKEEGLYDVVIRNESLNLVSRRLGLAALVSVFAAIVGVFCYLGVAGKSVPPQYVPITEEGRLLPLIPLSQPNVDDGALGAFALKAVREINNYDYLGWKTQILRGRPLFTPAAWNDFYDEFEASNIINTVEARQMIVVAHPAGNVEIENRGRDDSGVYMWRVAVPVQIRYVSHSLRADETGSVLTTTGRATLYIARVPTTLSPQGIAIRAYQFASD